MEAVSMSKPIECSVRPVSGRADLRTFERIGRRMRSQQPGWVAPLKLMERQVLDRRRHPFYENGRAAEAEFFIARDSTGQPVGRIGAIVNHRYDEHVRQRDGHEHAPGFFGFFDSINSPEVATALIETAKDWLRARQRPEMMGPASPSETYDYGVLVEGFDQPHRFLCAYQPQYYASLLEHAGLIKAKDLLGMTLDLHRPDVSDLVERFFSLADAARERGYGEITLRTPDIKKFDAEMKLVCKVFNEALGHLWGHCPVGEEELADIAWSLRRVAIHEALVIAEHHGQPVGVVLTIPDLNEIIDSLRLRWRWSEPLELLLRARRWQPNCVRTLVLGVAPGHERSLVVPALVGEFGRNVLSLGVRYIDAHLVLEDNASIMTPLTRYGFLPNRRYRVYRQDL